ncbi:guanyl-specific ribonuclease [Actinophytocola sediminis]
MGSSRRITYALIGLVVLVLGGWFVQDTLTDDAPTTQDLPVRALSELPDEAGGTWRLIERGGPFPHEEDGTVFGNRERLLPEAESAYYREYTVDTPGQRDRGARRLVTGGDGELYYTGDHYQSFVSVDPRR